VHARAGMTRPVAHRSVSVVRGACTSMRASLHAATLHASFVSGIVARFVDCLLPQHKYCITVMRC